jgi:hypothetical protein
MITHTLVNLMLAAVTAELVHALSEVFSARFKVGQLAAWIRGEQARDLPGNINTRVKAYAVLCTVAVVLVGVAFAVFSALDPSTHTAVVYTLTVVIATYALTAIGFDRFHAAIGDVGRQLRSTTDHRSSTSTTRN